MPRKRRGRASQKAQRRAAGLQAQEHLTNLLRQPEHHSPAVLDSAAVHLVKTSRRHRLPLTGESKDRVCRKCWSHHVHSSRFRVRIKGGQRIKTCLKCGTVRRFGGGPKHHRQIRREV